MLVFFKNHIRKYFYTGLLCIAACFCMHTIIPAAAAASSSDLEVKGLDGDGSVAKEPPVVRWLKIGPAGQPLAFEEDLLKESEMLDFKLFTFDEEMFGATEQDAYDIAASVQESPQESISSQAAHHDHISDCDRMPHDIQELHFFLQSARDLRGGRGSSGARDARAKLWNRSTQDLLHIISVANYFDIKVLFNELSDILATRVADSLKTPKAIDPLLAVPASMAAQAHHCRLDRDTEQAIVKEISKKFSPREILNILAPDKVNSVAWSPDGTKIVSAGLNDSGKIWDVVMGRLLQKLVEPKKWTEWLFASHKPGLSQRWTSVAWIPDGTKIVSGSWDKTIKIWDAATGELENTLTGHTDKVASVAFSSDGTKIVSGSSDKTIKIWSATTGILIHTLVGHASWVSSVAFSPDGTKIVSGSWDKTIKLWNVLTGTLVNTFAGHTDSVTSVAFNPDGTKIVSGYLDSTIKTWDKTTKILNHTLAGHDSWVSSVAFSPDGTKIVSGASDNTVKIWDALTGVLLNTLSGHSEGVSSVAWSPDGTKIVSGSYDKTIKIWQVAPTQEDKKRILETLYHRA